MTSPEQANPPSPYDALYIGFGAIAARGIVYYGPLGHSFDPGDDGTRTPEGGVASGFDYTLGGDALPQGIQEKGIDEVGVLTYASTIVGGEIWPERVRVEMHEAIGLRKVVTFRKEMGEIAATLSMDLDSDTDVAIETPSEANAIIKDLVSGKTHWLGLEGPAGDFARSIYVNLTAPDEPGIDELDLLNFILQELNR